MKAAIYIRVSTDEQAKEGVSLAMQEDLCTKYVDLHDLRPFMIYKDEGKSAGTLDRDGLRRMRADIAGGIIDNVIVLKLDRLTRNVGDLGTLLREWDKLDVALHGVRDKLDTATPSGRLVINIMGAVAEWERDTIRERVKDGMAEVRAQGYHVGAAPYGWEAVAHAGPGQLLRPSMDYPNIKAARRDRHKCDESLSGIARAYRGVSHPQAGKRIIEAPLIQEMVEVHPGLYRYKKEGE